MSETFTVIAQTRTDLGKGASRRLRRAGKVPAVVYGYDAPVAITLAHNEMIKHAESDAFFAHILNLEIDGKSEQVIVSDMQRHPAKPFITHVDFQRVKKGQEFTTAVPLHFINEEQAIGVKEQGGMLNQLVTEVQIACIPSKLPEFIEVDVSKLEVGGLLYLSDIQFPDGVRSIIDWTVSEEHNVAIIACNKIHEQSEDEAGEESAPSAE